MQKESEQAKLVLRDMRSEQLVHASLLPLLEEAAGEFKDIKFQIKKREGEELTRDIYGNITTIRHGEMLIRLSGKRPAGLGFRDFWERVTKLQEDVMLSK